MDELLKPVAMLGISFVGSLLQGKFIKDKTNMPNDTIPTQTNAAWGLAGIGAALTTGDPVVGVTGFVGATAASLTHKLFRKLFG